MSGLGADAAPRAGAAKLLGWLPAGRTSRRLLAIFFIDSIGTGLFLAGSALFFTRALGLSTAQVGLGLSLSAVAGFLCSVPLGRLADRHGGRRTLVALYVWRGLGFVAYVLVDDLAGFLLVACLLGAGEWAVGPLVQALVGAAEEGESRVRTMAAMNAVRNAGFMLGALIATLAIASDNPDAYRALVVADAVSFFAAALLLTRISVGGTRPRTEPAAERRVRVRDPRYLMLAASNGVLSLHTVVLSVGLPLWIATRTQAPAAVVGVVVALNTALAITLGVRLSRGADGLRAGAARHNRAGWCLAACCALVVLSGELGSAGATVVLLAATVVLTLGELWQSMGGWGVSYALAPDDQRSTYLTIYYLGEPLASMAGPALLTMAVITAGSAGWLALACLFALAGLVVRTVAGRPRERAERHARPKEQPCVS